MIAFLGVYIKVPFIYGNYRIKLSRYHCVIASRCDSLWHQLFAHATCQELVGRANSSKLSRLHIGCKAGATLSPKPSELSYLNAKAPPNHTPQGWCYVFGSVQIVFVRNMAEFCWSSLGLRSYCMSAGGLPLCVGPLEALFCSNEPLNLNPPFARTFEHAVSAYKRPIKGLDSVIFTSQVLGRHTLYFVSLYKVLNMAPNIDWDRVGPNLLSPKPKPKLVKVEYAVGSHRWPAMEAW